MRYFICISYNGTHYHGWQVQDNAPTVQADLNRALTVLLGEPIVTVGAGRTDAGVHARRYIAHFDSENMENRQSKMNIIYKLNCILPPAISVHSIIPVHETAHARFDAVERTYKYYINTSPDPFLLEFSTYIPYALDVTAMNEACAKLFDYDDFTSFAKLHSDNKTTICKITEAVLDVVPGGLVFTISADRFLRNMVRAIVGTMLEVGRGKISSEGFACIIEHKKRGAAGISAPAKGLFFEQVKYSYLPSTSLPSIF
jgi:tRNA pseudouridine38-40 synthase